MTVERAPQRRVHPLGLLREREAVPVVRLLLHVTVDAVAGDFLPAVGAGVALARGGRRAIEVILHWFLLVVKCRT